MIRLGIINYINSVPLGQGTDEFFEVYRGTPSEVSDAFLRGDLDVAFISAVEYLRNREKCVPVADLCIASHGETRSVFVFSRIDFNDVRTLQLDPDSRTSNFLAEYILQERYGTIVEIVDKSPADAFVLIGDEALTFDASDYNVLDIGHEWYELTHLPVVYSVCAAISDEIASKVQHTLCCLRNSNLDNLPDLLNAARCREHESYIKNLDYSLSRAHYRSLEIMGRLIGNMRGMEKGKGKTVV